jgi:uncharacterized protein YggE
MNRLVAVAAVVLAVVAGASAQAPATGNEASGIVTQGVGTLKLQADQAWVSIAVEARAGKAADARARAATQMNAVRTAIRGVGLPADALKTSTFSLEPQVEADSYSGVRKRVREYAVRNEIEVRVDNLDLLSEVLDAAGTVKTSDTLSVSIEGLRFHLKNPAAAEQDALQMAVKDAMARAQSMASGAGRTLGGIVRIEEQFFTDAAGVPNMQTPVRIQTRTNTDGRGGGGQGQRATVDTPVEPNQIEFRSFVVLTASIR